MTSTAPPALLTRERNFILGSLLALAAIAWAVIIMQAGQMRADMSMLGASMLMGGSVPPVEGMQASMPIDAPMQAADAPMAASMPMRDSMPMGASMPVPMEAPMPADASISMEQEVSPPKMRTDFVGLTMNMGAMLFIGLWAAMMVAIMFPTAAPMILTFARMQSTRRDRGQVFVPTWLFTGSYIALWIATGVVAYAIAVGGDALAHRSVWILDNAARFGGGLLILAGIYQLTPLKRKCLSKCRTPLSFILNSWRDGKSGAVRMGLEHGVYCLGCCWLLFAILFPLGMMNVAAMATITGVIFVEKSFAIGPRIAQIAAVALIAYGAVVIAIPNALPTMI